MKRVLVEILIIITAFILQSTVFRAISLGGIVPNLLIIITSAFGIMRGRRAGMLTGFTCGLLIDIFFGSVIGFYALVYMVIGYLNGIFQSLFYPEDVKLPMILISLSEVVYCFICYVFLFLLRSRLHLGYYIVHIILPEIVYTIVATIVLYRGILYVNEWLETPVKR
ncbi:MAG: rod shape-determining protein MreD [Lachnospiraceae bacterium]|nr:rod shape-determining protein MreD [Lachnospiraceae bacterium]MBQ7261366.1 rod shape-determining protein MreD [Lachnospiraceae bacterium]HAV01011.1 rod shape-determining protein MreD [Lachnospiraceae bacterium]